ncbi:SpoIIE family protein phosphatase [Estrella lausannensis]|uniref:Two-component system, response regulator n=1 Tax=Estrella lausannensis TaxID=483423 RepID=A0A0H5DRQ8_9BACT|nr:SpoIIE family protein phosphatase [Estrella lausannensis]CRX39292.1 Two-component system, response regulator [Estrella lausannensis]
MKEKLLVINDDDDVRDVISLFLKSRAFEVLEASDGYQGIEKAALNAPDLILLDVMMPGIDGYQVCRELKKNPATKEIPVIFLSSLNDPKDKITGLESGGVDFVTRVEDKGELLARVQTHLKLAALTNAVKEQNAELIQKQRLLDNDLKMAASIQRSLLPDKKFQSAHMTFAWKCLPCEMIGGDIFNSVPVDESHAAVYILDVSGHGVASAMVTVAISQFIQQFIRSFPKNQGSIMNLPQVITEQMNKEFPYERFNEFFTLFFMVINTETAEVSYCNGGHPPPVILRPEHLFEVMEGNEFAIGIADARYPLHRKKLQKKDKIVLYTDGILECRNSLDEMYGQDRFYTLLEKIKSEEPDNFVHRISVELSEFTLGSPPMDDISLMVIEF